MENTTLQGFDIELAKLIGKKLHKKTEFKDMQFSNLLQAINANQIDAAISTIAITEERKKNFDFSNPYYFSGVAAIFNSENKIRNIEDLKGKKIACQLGTTMEIWAKEKLPNNELNLLNSNNQAIELLKNHYTDVVLVDESQGAEFSNQDDDLEWSVIDKSENGYGIVFKKGSKLTTEVNKALDELKTDGSMQELEEKWFGSN
jgi:polar amino acid transport system substrate-binding protein